MQRGRVCGARSGLVETSGYSGLVDLAPRQRLVACDRRNFRATSIGIPFRRYVSPTYLHAAVRRRYRTHVCLGSAKLIFPNSGAARRLRQRCHLEQQRFSNRLSRGSSHQRIYRRAYQFRLCLRHRCHLRVSLFRLDAAHCSCAAGGGS